MAAPACFRATQAVILLIFILHTTLLVLLVRHIGAKPLSIFILAVKALLITIIGLVVIIIFIRKLRRSDVICGLIVYIIDLVASIAVTVYISIDSLLWHDYFYIFGMGMVWIMDILGVFSNWLYLKNLKRPRVRRPSVAIVGNNRQQRVISYDSSLAFPAGVGINISNIHQPAYVVAYDNMRPYSRMSRVDTSQNISLDDINHLTVDLPSENGSVQNNENNAENESESGAVRDNGFLDQDLQYVTVALPPEYIQSRSLSRAQPRCMTAMSEFPPSYEEAVRS